MVHKEWAYPNPYSNRCRLHRRLAKATQPDPEIVEAPATTPPTKPSSAAAFCVDCMSQSGYGGCIKHAAPALVSALVSTIHSDVDLAKALAEIGPLLDSKPGSQDATHLEEPSNMVCEYEAEYHPILPPDPPAGEPEQ